MDDESHKDPADCPTWHDGCNCTVETCVNLSKLLDEAEKERDEARARADRLEADLNERVTLLEQGQPSSGRVRDLADVEEGIHGRLDRLEYVEELRGSQLDMMYERLRKLERGGDDTRALDATIMTEEQVQEALRRGYAVRGFTGTRLKEPAPDDALSDKEREVLHLRFTKVNDRMIGDLQAKITRLKMRIDELEKVQARVDEFVRWVDNENLRTDEYDLCDDCNEIARNHILAKLRELGLIEDGE